MMTSSEFFGSAIGIRVLFQPVGELCGGRWPAEVFLEGVEIDRETPVAPAGVALDGVGDLVPLGEAREVVDDPRRVRAEIMRAVGVDRARPAASMRSWAFPPRWSRRSTTTHFQPAADEPLGDDQSGEAGADDQEVGGGVGFQGAGSNGVAVTLPPLVDLSAAERNHGWGIRRWMDGHRGGVIRASTTAASIQSEMPAIGVTRSRGKSCGFQGVGRRGRRMENRSMSTAWGLPRNSSRIFTRSAAGATETMVPACLGAGRGRFPPRRRFR